MCQSCRGGAARCWERVLFESAGDNERARDSIVVDGQEVAAFSHLVDINMEVGKKPTIILRRALTSSRELDAWLQLVEEDKIAAARKNFTLIVSDPEGAAGGQVLGVLMVIQPGSLKTASSTETLSQQVTFTADEIKRVSPF